MVESVALHPAQVQTSALPCTNCETAGRLSGPLFVIRRKKGMVIGPTSWHF